VYGALVPAPAAKNGRGPKSDFVKRLCKYPGDPKVIAEAQKHILEAHAERLSKELGRPVTVKDIEEGKAPRPKVLDMFAGGGAIPLEALRLGCEAYALELNPVAHIIELCTLVYPQKYGKPDENAKGSAADGTWAGLAKEVEYWGNWVLEQVKAEIGDLYPPIPDPKNPPQKLAGRRQQEFGVPGFEKRQPELTTPGGYLTPVAYLWTRTVSCKNPACRARVPLAKLFWLCREREDREGRYVVLHRHLDHDSRRVVFTVAEGTSRQDLELGSAVGTVAGNVTCPFCSTVCDDQYVKEVGLSDGLVLQLMTVACVNSGRSGKLYLNAADIPEDAVPEDSKLTAALEAIKRRIGLQPPSEPVTTDGKQSVWINLYGLTDFGKVFTARQHVVGLCFSSAIREVVEHMKRLSHEPGHVTAVADYLAMALDRHMNQNNTLTIFNAQGETIEGAVNDKTLPMAWDFAEPNPFSRVGGSFNNALDWVVAVALELANVVFPLSAHVSRGTATQLAFPDKLFDAVATDPPYYDNVSYAVLSDFFYVWVKRAIGFLHPEHFAAETAPKRNETVMDALRYGGSSERAREAYHQMMAQAFREAHRVLKPNAPLTCVYAHKTTLGWATLVDSLRNSGFYITEAWPIETERKGGRKTGKAVLSSSVTLVARKREASAVGAYETEVRPDLDAIVRERVETLWEQGVSGADLVIAAVGAGLRAFTRFARVEYSNGEEVPAERFLAEVEGVVLETLLEKIFGLVGAKVSAVDGPSQFYVLWRYTYHALELEAGEAIVFTYGMPVELDGARGLSGGSRALVEKKKNKYRLRDFTERGDEDKLGILSQDGTPAPLIDVLHRVLYLMENQPAALSQFLSEAKPDLERLRLVANALAGPHLKGAQEDTPRVLTTPKEQSALAKLVANWHTVIEGRVTPAERAGQQRLL